jgi:hypothetical protein
MGGHGEDALLAWNLGGAAQQVLAVARASILTARSPSPAEDPSAPQRILVPLDGSLRAESVLPIVARIAKAHDAEVLLTHLVGEPSGAAMLRTEADLELARELGTRLDSAATGYLERLREQLGRSFGSVAAHIIAHSPVSLLVLQDLAEGELERPVNVAGDESAPKLRASYAPGKA